MSKQKYNIEYKNYAMKVMEWFYSIETDFDPDKHEVGESNYSIVVNTAPFKSMIVDLTRVMVRLQLYCNIHHLQLHKQCTLSPLSRFIIQST